MPVWWAVTFNDGQAGRTGYLALSSDRSQTLGIYFADGSPVPAQPTYGYTPTDTAAAVPSWGAGVADPAAQPVPAATQTVTAADFILLFTPAEAHAINASADPVVQQFMLAVEAGNDINLASSVTQNGVNYLAAVGLIAAARVPQILGNAAHA